MSSRAGLRVEWASYDATRYACMHWHYSRSMPVGKMVKVGAWEDGQFIGVVTFSRGANRHLLSPYGLDQTQGCELTRVALNAHRTPVSRIVSIALRMLRRVSPGLRLVVSYADEDEGHHGGIYQAGGWIYEGIVNVGVRSAFVINGKKVHQKTIHSRGVKQNLASVRKYINARATEHHTMGKHKYLMPLDAAMRERVASLSKPYPKRAKEQAPADHAGLGGATPTRTLPHNQQEP